MISFVHQYDRCAALCVSVRKGLGHTMKNRFIICLFFTILLSGLIFQLSGRRHDLYGVSAPSQASTGFSGIMDGSWQTGMEDILNDQSVLRTWLIPFRNQITYSVFHTSPHNSVVLGKDNYLYEETYILKELQIIPPVSDGQIDDLIGKLSLLQNLLSSRGKKLFVFITPSKAHVYPEYIPDSYKSLAPQSPGTSSYEKLLAQLPESGIPYYDSVPYVLATRNLTEYPAYTATGIHWTHVKGFDVAQQLSDAIEEQLELNLPEFEISWRVNPAAIGADRDVEELMNIFSRQGCTYYAPSITIADSERDSADLLVRGGSFLGMTVYNLMDFHFFDSTYYMENTQLIDCGEISYFTSYEELDLERQLELADIVLLEVNQEKIDDMCFGFIEYLLDHILTD